MKRHRRPLFYRCQRGLSLVTAIFLLLLLAGLAALMASILSATHVNLAADIGGSRAYLAARAGVEWGMFQLDANAQSSDLPNCPSPQVLNAIPGHQVRVQCVAYPRDGAFYSEGGRQIRIFRITATATALGVRAPGIEREVQVTIEKCRDPAITASPFDC